MASAYYFTVLQDPTPLTQLPRRVHLSIDEDGLHLRTHVTIPPPREAWRQFRFWLGHVRQQLSYSFWPVGPLALGVRCMLATTIVCILFDAGDPLCYYCFSDFHCCNCCLGCLFAVGFVGSNRLACKSCLGNINDDALGTWDQPDRASRHPCSLGVGAFSTATCLWTTGLTTCTAV